MKIAVWKTGHEIADRVAESLARGIPDAEIRNTNDCDVSSCVGKLNIAYGILRGTSEIFHKSQRWFNLDRGFFKPSHYSGYYRISYRGTQQTERWVEPDYERLAQLALDLKPWRGFDHSKPVLVCPPTNYVMAFFGLPGWNSYYFGSDYVIRTKGDTSPINFNDYNYVVTFNSSVGWQALQAGIPCVSDATHSMIGSWFAKSGQHKISLAELSDLQYIDRNKLFATMAASQFTLAEIEQGKAWDYIKHYVKEHPCDNNPGK